MSNFISFDLKETYMHCILVRREKNIRQGGENVFVDKRNNTSMAQFAMYMHAYVASVSDFFSGAGVSTSSVLK
jgi:hypothetical protein